MPFNFYSNNRSLSFWFWSASLYGCMATIWYRGPISANPTYEQLLGEKNMGAKMLDIYLKTGGLVLVMLIIYINLINIPCAAFNHKRQKKKKNYVICFTLTSRMSNTVTSAINKKSKLQPCCCHLLKPWKFHNLVKCFTFLLQLNSIICSAMTMMTHFGLRWKFSLSQICRRNSIKKETFTSLH